MICTDLIVNTWAKYNCGILCVLTVNPAHYKSQAEFYARCKEMHSDESSPEFLFQSPNGLPSAIVDESDLNWDLMTALVRHEKDGNGAAFIAFLKLKGESAAQYFEASYAGKADTQIAALEIIVDLDAILEKLPADLRGYFDFEAYARDLFISDYDLFDGFIFKKI